MKNVFVTNNNHNEDVTSTSGWRIVTRSSIPSRTPIDPPLSANNIGCGRAVMEQDLVWRSLARRNLRAGKQAPVVAAFLRVAARAEITARWTSRDRLGRCRPRAQWERNSHRGRNNDRADFCSSRVGRNDRSRSGWKSTRVTSEKRNYNQPNHQLSLAHPFFVNLSSFS